jgi:hypothetical protein
VSILAPVELIERTRELVARRRRQLGLALALSAVPVLGLGAVVIDASAALPTWARVVVAGLVVLSSVGVALVMVGWWRLLQPAPEQARRLTEHALGDEHRHLTAAMELATMPGPLAGQAAQQFAGTLDPERLVPGLPPARLKRPLLCAVAALFLLGVIHLIWPTVLPAVLPRLYDPFGDHPPWSRTLLTLVEPPTRVRPPVTVRLVVQADGPQPRELVLQAHDAMGKPVARVVMLAIGGNQWAANLGPITAEQVTSLASPLRIWVEGAGTRTHYHALAIDPVPTLTDGRLALISPSYSRLPEATFKLGAVTPVVAALPGSRLNAQLQANRPVRAIDLLRDGHVERQVTSGDFTLEDPAPGAWTVVLEAEDGIRSDPLPLATVSRRIDQPPRVRFEQPQSDGVATPDMSIPLVISADDDLGLTRLTRYRVRNNTTETEGRDALGGTSDTWRGSLQTRGMRPGDVVRVGAVVSDTAPPDGQVSSPAERVIHIISHADYNAMVMEHIDQHALEQKYGELLSRIAELEQQIADAAQQPPSPERSAKLDALAAKAAELGAQVAALRRPEPLFAIEPELQDELEKHLQALERHAQQAKDQAANGQTPKAAERLRQDLQTMTAQAEADALREHLAELAAAQRQAANELADLEKQGIRSDADRARLREASRHQQEMEQALKEWQEAAKDVAKRLQADKPDEASELNKLCDQVGACEADRLAGQAGRAARGGRVGDAQRDAEEAARRLEALAAAGKGTGDGQGEGKGKGKGKQPGWCPGDGYGRCQSQLQGLAKRGFNPSGSVSGSGGGATGARGGGMQVRRGGRSTPSGEQLQLFGPEALSALSGATSGQQKSGTAGAEASGSSAEPRAATAYATGTRATTAGVGATFSPGEQVLIEDYFRRLDGDPTAPATPDAPGPSTKPAPPAIEAGNTPP